MDARARLIGIGIGCQIGWGAAAILALCALPVLAQAPAPAPVDVPPSAGIAGVLAQGGVTRLMQEGFTFTEGPVGTADGGLYFTDIPPNRIYHLDSAGKISLAYEGTNGANGLALTKDGELVSVEGGGKKVTKRAKDGTVTVLTEGAQGMTLMAPNDLILDAKGGIYFTDPGPFPPVPGRIAYVYYLPAGTKSAIVIDNQNPLPNGLVLTNDGKTLIVNDTLGTTLWAFDIKPDGTVANKHAFATLRGTPAGRPSGADGMAIDRDDRIYVATVTGVQVFDGKGEYLGTIGVPRQPTNVAFAGLGKQTLFITARQGLYRVNMLAKGPDRLGK